MYDNNQYTFNPFAQNLSIIKNYFKRPAVLVLAIIYIASLIASVAISLTMIPAMTNIWGAMLSIPEVASELTAEDMSMFSTYMSPNVMFTSMLSSMAPSLIMTALISAAYIIIYVKSKNNNYAATPQAGFTILYILAILNLISAIMACVWILLIAVITVVISISTNSSSTEQGLTTVLVISCAIFALLIAMLLTYAISNVRYIKSVKDSMNSVTLSCKGAGVYGGFCIVFAVFSIFGVLGSLVMTGLFSMMGELVPELAQYGILEALTPIYLISAVSSVISAVMYITDAVIARGYKKYITNIVTGYMGPDQPAPYMAEPVATANEQPVYSNDMPVIEPSQCPHCGATTNSADTFCNGCGFKLR